MLGKTDGRVVAFVSIPAYTMQGAYMALRNRFAKSVENYISTSRVLQGGEEYDAATPEERAEILARWEGMKLDLKNFYALKLKEAKDGKEKESRLFDRHEGPTAAPNQDVAPLLSPRSRGESMGRFGADWKRIKARDLWRRGHGDVKVPAGGHHDEELERAIRLSVKETSRGDAEDDARVEMAVRASVNQLQAEGAPVSPGDPGAQKGPSEETRPEAGPARGEVDLAITDEEYQELIERAIQQSTAGAGTAPDDEEFQRALERSRKEAAAPEEERDAELRRAIEESRAAPALPPRGGGGEGDGDDEELRRAIEASAREEADREKKAKSEEEIVLEYVMRQSLKEEEYKRAMRGEEEGERWGGEVVERVVDEGPGKGKGRGEEEVEYEEDEEELRRAMEMSMRAGEQWGGEGPGPSSHGKE